MIIAHLNNEECLFWNNKWKNQYPFFLHEWISYPSFAMINSSGFWGIHYSSPPKSAGRSSCPLPWGCSRFSVCLPHSMKPPPVVEGAGNYTFWVNCFFVFLVVFFFFSSPLRPTWRFLAFTFITAQFLFSCYYLYFLFLCYFSHMFFLMIPPVQHNLSPLCYIFTYYLYSSRVLFQVKRFPLLSFSDWYFPFSHQNFLQVKY